jgi:hypothetical protein
VLLEVAPLPVAARELVAFVEAHDDRGWVGGGAWVVWWGTWILLLVAMLGRVSAGLMHGRWCCQTDWVLVWNSGSYGGT